MKSGYEGKDAMRGKAEKMFSGECGGKRAEFAKGGKVMKHKATGGSTYEGQMLGEHPSSKKPHINYEGNMKGEERVSKAKKEGGIIKKAIGGVGKIRHGAATADGKQISKKVNINRG